MMEVNGCFRRKAVRVLRGGAWNNDADNLRAAARDRNHVWNRNDNVGFRCCLCVGGPNTISEP